MQVSHWLAITDGTGVLDGYRRLRTSPLSRATLINADDVHLQAVNDIALLTCADHAGAHFPPLKSQLTGAPRESELNSLPGCVMAIADTSNEKVRSALCSSAEVARRQ